MKIEDVVKRGICVGCGGCGVVGDRSIRILRTELHTYLPDMDGGSSGAKELADRICPFTDASPNESDLGARIFSSKVQNHHEKIGYYESFYAGRVSNESQIQGSSSGGLTSWFLLKLMDLGYIDGVIHVGEGQNPESIFAYVVSENREQVLSRRKSKYYSVEFSSALNEIRGNGKRYAFVGTPCFVKAVRTIVGVDDVLKEQVVWFVGLVCGHMKSGAFGLVMAHQLGVEPSRVKAIDFRVKDPSKTVHSYSFGVLPKDEASWLTRTSSRLLGGNWGHALFQLNACDYCDDIFAETADICFGDAWLPKYDDNWRGTNVVLNRNAVADGILLQGMRSGELQLEDISLDELLHTQSGNFRHRHDGLSYRLKRDVEKGLSVPKKRIDPGQFPLSPARRWIIVLRQRMARRSHFAYLEATRAEDMGIFYREMNALARRMKLLHRLDQGPVTIFRLALRKIAKKLQRM